MLNIVEKQSGSFQPLIDYDSPLALRRYLDQHGLGMQKKFGQNFLINGAVRRRLVQALELPASSAVWEAGPGLGAMTVELLRQGAHVTAFEIDRGFSLALDELLPAGSDFTLISGDVLKTWPKEAEREKAGGRVAEYFLGNLPYNIAATLLAELIEGGRYFRRLVVTVQREVAARMLAKPGSRDYSSFTVLCTSAYVVKPLMVLKGPSFYPVPHVDSQAITMERRTDRNPDADSPLFRSLVRSLFSNRRKNLKNNLVAFLSGRFPNTGEDLVMLADTAITRSGLKSQQRAEELDLDAFVALSQQVGSLLCQ